MWVLGKFALNFKHDTILEMNFKQNIILNMHKNEREFEML